ncbi:unnamed protein product, partial [Linum tenue]
MRSWVWRNSLASSGEETTTVEVSPSWSCIRGPCSTASSISRRWGKVGPIRLCRFPSMGSFLGPGGSV